MRGATALGTHGMGGVGKTTALKGICREKEVLDTYPDGVCFMQFGQDASGKKVRSEIVRCVRNFGGVELSRQLEQAKSIGEVVDGAAMWFKGRTILLVCDDIWESDASQLGFVPELKNTLRDAPRSGLLVSTRDRNIARAISDTPVDFVSLDVQGPKALEILGKSAFGKEWVNHTSRLTCNAKYMEILNVCAGLPLALGIAGRGISVEFKDCKDESAAISSYWDGLQERKLSHMQEPNLEYHPDGLIYVAEASLAICAEWGRSNGRKYEMRLLFESLCILEKQEAIPESTLMLYWSMSKHSVHEVVRKFADLSIVRREKFDRDYSRNGGRA